MIRWRTRASTTRQRNNSDATPARIMNGRRRPRVPSVTAMTG